MVVLAIAFMVQCLADFLAQQFQVLGNDATRPQRGEGHESVNQWKYEENYNGF